MIKFPLLTVRAMPLAVSFLLSIQGAMALPNWTWTGSTSSDWATANNWLPKSVPAETSNPFNGGAVNALFAGAVPASQPFLNQNNSVVSVDFTTGTGGWLLSGTNTATLGLGYNTVNGLGGISTLGQSSGTDTIGVNITFSGTGSGATSSQSSIVAGTGGTLVLNGSVNAQGFRVLLGASGSGEGTIVINSAMVDANTTGAGLAAGTMVLNVDDPFGASPATVLSAANGGDGVTLVSGGTGTRTLTKILNLDNNLTISGTTALSISGGIGVLSNGNTLTNNSSAKVFVFSGITTSNSLTISGTGFATVLRSSASIAGGLSINGNLWIGNGNSNDGSIDAGLVSIGSTGTLSFNRTGTYSFDRSLSGSGLLQQLGSATRTITQNNSAFTGATLVTAGKVIVGNVGALGSGGQLMVNGGTLDLNGNSIAVGSLSGASGGVITTGISGSASLTTAVASGTSTYNGKIQDGLGTVSFVKAGTGVLVLSGSNSYSGQTTVSAGTLLINGNNGSSAITVQNGGILGGSGTMGAVSVQSGGFLTPGDSPSVTTTAGITLNSGASLNITISGSTATPLAGVQYSSVNVNGTVTLGGNIQLSLAGYTPVPNTVYFILTNDSTDPISGVFGNLSGVTSPSDVFALDGQQWRINYNAEFGSTSAGNFNSSLGNDIALLAVPEPRLITLIGLGVLFLVVKRFKNRGVLYRLT